jgi:hypothetical protein
MTTTINLSVVGVVVGMQMMCMNQSKQIRNVEEKQDWSKNRTLRYSTDQQVQSR